MMIRIFLSAVFLVFLFPSSSKSEGRNLLAKTMDDLVERERLYYKKFSDVPFTGSVKVEGSNYRIVKGVKDGHWIDIWKNSGHREQGKYNQGLRIGSWRGYHPNGQLWYKVFYKKDGADGIKVSYYKDGSLETKGKYVNGKKEGLWVSYWRSGAIMYKGNFKNGKKEGFFIEGDASYGRQIKLLYEKGKLIKEIPIK